MRHIPSYAALLTLVVGSLASGCKQGPGRYESIAVGCVNSSYGWQMSVEQKRSLIAMGRDLDSGKPCAANDMYCVRVREYNRGVLENMERGGCR